MVNDKEIIYSSPAYKYAIDCLREDNKNVGKYVKKQCKEFLKCIDSDKYYIDTKVLNFIYEFCKLINIMPNKNAYDTLAGFQWFFIINMMCVKRRLNKKRRYELSILLIARKNGKTLLTSLILLLKMFEADPRAEAYSVAPDRELSSQVYKELIKIIENSPAIRPYFKILRNEVRCTINNCVYKPLACSDNRLDGRLASFWIGDEVGALKNNYPLEAMKSSQITLDEKMGVIISTAYESLENPMTENIDYAKKILDGLVNKDTIFALIYEPDEPKEWMKDYSLFQANPLALEVPVIKESVMAKREDAINVPSSLTNFKTKHMNIFLDGNELEVYVSLEDLRKCKIDSDSYDWTDKDVYVGVDLALTTDNTALTMVTYDTELQKYVCKSWCFYPADREDEKIKMEDVPYDRYARQGLCFSCGGRIIDYKFVEDFLLKLPEKYGVNIKNITYDPYNAMSSIQKWESELPMCQMVEQRQHSVWLHPGTKRLREIILEEKFLYEDNKLLEINFQNAKLDTDTALNMYVNKKKSNGRIDMLDALINAICSMVTDELEQQCIYDSQPLYFF